MSLKQSAKAQTPLMKQYLTSKGQYPEALLFFRLGDFYELFFEDAVTVAKTLDLKLTTRDKNDPDPIPMCGVPHHSAQSYISRLVALGYNVAICEQLEDPAKAKGIVKRAVVRVLTPALVLDGDGVDARANQFLAAILPPEEPSGVWSIAAFDLTTAEIFCGEARDTAALAGELARLDARELLCGPAEEATARAVAKLLPRAYVRIQRVPEVKEATEILAAVLGEASLKESAEGISVPGRLAAAMALAYARACQPGQAIAVQRLVKLDARDYLCLDETAQQHLELFVNVRGERRGTLLAHVDETVTPMGARRLRNWLAFPLTDARRIRRRHDAVAALREEPDARREVRTQLSALPDMERIAIRATLGAATPKDLCALRDGLGRLAPLALVVEALGPVLKGLRVGAETAPLHALLCRALVDAPKGPLSEGGVIRKGFDAALDELTSLASGGRDEIDSIEQRERERTKINSLKVNFNRISGFYIEVTKANLKNVPDDYKRKQTIANGERFITEELYALEQKVLGADEQRFALEAKRFGELVSQVASLATVLSRVSNLLADLDALASFAEVAHRYDYVRPELDDTLTLELRDSRHPVVETLLEPGAFVPNDVKLDGRGERLWLVTGPNMAGKSTLIRQAALCVVLAQAGAFVPARSARIGVVDKVFTRVGASDDLTRGQSTFMVEMRETASILRGASARSLVVFDEIGRGTSTFDGLAIAWAVAEYLHDVVRCRALFATHYLELCALPDGRPHAANVNVSARESGEEIVFLHKLSRGAASRSYGIAVARLAGLPEPVVARARILLRDLERGEGPGVPAKQRELFAPAPTPAPEPARQHPVVAALEGAELERMTPLDALNFLAQLRGLLTRAER